MAAPSYDAWFRMADEDKDGAVGGAEAVKFFMRSGLPQETLGYIWELASGGSAKLNNVQFAAAMRLVALAQASNGRLPLDQGRVVVAGMGPPLPPPRMAGLEVAGTPPAAPAAPGYPPAALPPGYTTQTTGGQAAPVQPQMPPQSYTPQSTPPAYSPQVTGASGYTPQHTGGAPPRPGMPPAYSPQTTGQGMPGMPPVMPLAAPAPTGAQAGFPPATPQEMQRYQTTFIQLDSDKDGFVQGGECFGYFLQWGLDKAVLRDIWNVVAGTAGQLNSEQFVKCLYLMDGAKKGRPVPQQLPPGPFPPVGNAAPVVAPRSGPAAAGDTAAVLAAAIIASSPAPSAAPAPAPVHQPWSLQSQFGNAGMQATVNQSYVAQAAPAVQMPPLPAKVEFKPEEAVIPPKQSALPVVDAALMAGLNNNDRTKLELERKEAETREKRLQEVQADMEMSKKRNEAYKRALQDLLLFKSRTDVALLQAQDQESRLQQEADETARKYQQAYQGAEAQHEQGKKLAEHIQKLMQQKVENDVKLRALVAELEKISQMSPDQVKALEVEVSKLEEQIQIKELERDAKQMQLDNARKNNELLAVKLEQLKAVNEAASLELASSRQDIAALAAEIEAQQQSGEVAEMSQVLTEAARTYRDLYSKATKNGVAVPVEAQVSDLRPQLWVDDLVAGAADWLEQEDTGMVLVNALPELDATLSPSPLGKGLKSPGSFSIKGAPGPALFLSSTSFGARAAAATPMAAAAAAAAVPLGVALPAVASGASPQPSPKDADGAPAAAASPTHHAMSVRSSMAASEPPLAQTASQASDYSFDDNAF